MVNQLGGKSICKREVVGLAGLVYNVFLAEKRLVRL